MNRGASVVARLAARCSCSSQHSQLALYSSTPANNPGADYDVVVVGGGIVGCATAMLMKQRHPQLRMALLEKHDKLARHQSGNNSMVIHAGLYYEPGSLRAKLCVRGMDLLYKYCDKYNVPYKKVGKLVVASDETEVGRMKNIFERASTNKCPDIRIIGQDEMRQLEPHVAGVQAIHSPHTGIIDFEQVTNSYAEQFRAGGGDVFLSRQVSGFQQTDDGNVRIETKANKPVTAGHVITCGGLHADRLAVLSGCDSEPKIVPFRGEYLLLKPEKRHLINGNVYPVPDPRFPFLGVHFTPRMNGDVWLGPNAVLAYAREGYSHTQINLRDMAEALSYGGIHRLGIKYFGFGIKEVLSSLFMSLQVKKLQKLVPEITRADVMRGPAGVRAQALRRDGTLVEDFIVDTGKGSLVSRVLHVRNAPSPAATSSLAIAEMIADRAEHQFTALPKNIEYPKA